MNSNRTDPESPGEWLIEHGPTIGTVMLLVGAGGSLAMALIQPPASGPLHVLWGFLVIVMLIGLALSRVSGRLRRRSRRKRARR